jgi:plasmid stability protein
MGVDMTIRDIPESVAAEIRRRATEHRRSPETEAAEMLAASTGTRPRLTLAEFAAKVRAMGISTPDEAAAMVREDRDGGHRD